MIITFEINSISYTADTSFPFIISIPLNFNSEQPNSYNVPKATSSAYEADGFVGDTRRGGGCNFEVYTLITHCNGTHTECIGHIAEERISVSKVLKDSFFPATLITLEPEKASAATDSYDPPMNGSDHIITKKILEEKLRNADKNFLKAVIIRTLPNDSSKMTKNYMTDLPPYFTIEAMEYISNLKVHHLLMDIPSVDRTFDKGKLTAHHIFWNVPFGSHDVDKIDHSLKTITEMIYAADDISDGVYLLNIQIPDFTADAAPSRIMLYNILKNNSIQI
ncbi:MAG TPA: cyclase family protein [Ignavibacteria bacterium]|nr:cyclase family protein [Ignavibacteria bacterium]